VIRGESVWDGGWRFERTSDAQAAGELGRERHAGRVGEENRRSSTNSAIALHVERTDGENVGGEEVKNSSKQLRMGFLPMMK
jgi:hypothetical protein